MADQAPTPSAPGTDAAEGTGAADAPDPSPDPVELHVASDVDVVGELGRDERVEAVLTRGDLRDQAAARRDRAADTRVMIGPGDGATDREWSARDRDLAAEDRADLLDLFHERGFDAVDQGPRLGRLPPTS